METAMRGMLWTSGMAMGAMLLLAGVARAECRPSDECTDGACRTIITCANAERAQKTASAESARGVQMAANAATPAPRAMAPTPIAPRRTVTTVAAAPAAM